MKSITNSQKGNIPLDVSASEARLIRAFRGVRDGTQVWILATLEACASDPSIRRPERPTLQLVACNV